ncbi:PHB depolymerase family esterase [Jiella pelagia]|uniref:PHB depolymerase family esterase n=1 Tax=Jiella pelagia TaxID=2986949 RepID=UPI002E30CB44|nr:PHB depolymerase family esterase [Jiella pelagia]
MIMNAFSNVDMQEVTRLTREGRLEEAMRLIRGGLTGQTAASSTDEAAGGGKPNPASPSRDGAATLDLKRPIGGGATWSVSGDPAASATGSAAPAKPKPSRPRAPAAEPLRADPTAGFSGSPLPTNPFADFGRSFMPDFSGLGASATVARSTEAPDGARFETRAHQGSAGSRDYKLYIPARHDGSPAPLVVMLHGCTQSPDDFAAGTRMNEARRGIRLPRRLSRAEPPRQCAKMLELVRAARPAPRHRRAGADRRDHP